MNFGEFRKHTQHTHLYLVKPHGCWAEASGVYMPTPHFNHTFNPIENCKLRIDSIVISSEVEKPRISPRWSR